MAIQKEIWLPVIAENLFSSLAHIKQAATDDSSYILSGKSMAKVVHIPNAGTPAPITKNSSYPLTITTRTDNDHNYSLDAYQMAPIAVPYVDAVQASYDKVKSVVNDLTYGLADRVLREIPISWYTDNTYKVVTTGAAYAAHAPNATGNRKGLTTSELKAAALKLDNMGIPRMDRYLLVDTTMYYQLLDELGVTAYRDAAIAKETTEPLKPLYDFNIIVLPSVVFLTSADAARAYGATGAAGDNACALAVHKSALSFAFDDVQLFPEEMNAAYQGSVISGLFLAGGKYRRYDKKGVVPIVQAAAS